MDSPETNPAAALFGLLMMLQLAVAVALLLGGIYVLYCLHRAAAGLDRLASVAEAWLASQTPAQTPILPHATSAAPYPTSHQPIPQSAPAAPREWTPQTAPTVTPEPPETPPIS